jgi:hypothetical protein
MEVSMAPEPDVLGGPEPDEQSDVLGGHDAAGGDELGGPEPDEQGGVLGGSDLSAEEDELGGPEAGGTDVLR